MPRIHQHIRTDVLFEEYLLRRAALARSEAELQTGDAVSAALAGGISWTRIGRLLGMSAASAKDKYGAARPDRLAS